MRSGTVTAAGGEAEGEEDATCRTPHPSTPTTTPPSDENTANVTTLTCTPTHTENK